MERNNGRCSARSFLGNEETGYGGEKKPLSFSERDDISGLQAQCRRGKKASLCFWGGRGGDCRDECDRHPRILTARLTYCRDFYRMFLHDQRLKESKILAKRKVRGG